MTELQNRDLADRDLADRYLADLAWAIESPSFVDGPNAAEAAQLDRAAIDVEHLAQFIGEPPRRVGQYFERLVHYWLAHVRKVEMVGVGQQVLDGKITIGEIDFLFVDEAGELNHWEVAVKFFLHHPDRPGSHYPGPNARDDFERKATKIFGPQLGLSETSHPDVTVRRAFVKGQVFYHPAVPTPTERPNRMPESHLRGEWIRSDQLDLLNDRWGDAQGMVLDKPHWLAAPPIEQHVSIGQVREQLEERFTVDANGRSGRPTMVAFCDRNGEPMRRLCVVSPDWDASTRSNS